MDMIAVLQVIFFSSDELSPAGINHNQLLFITVQFKSFRIPLTLVDNGEGLNVRPLRTANTPGFKVEDIIPATKGMTVFDNTHDSLGILVISLSIGAVIFDVEFYIVDLESTFNLLLGCSYCINIKSSP